MKENKCQIPIFECPNVQVCERVIVHDVNHYIPIHTKVINRHVFKHSYTPIFTKEECDTCENIYEPCQKTS